MARRLDRCLAVYAKRVNTFYKQADGAAMLWVRAETLFPDARCPAPASARSISRCPLPGAIQVLDLRPIF